MIPGRCVSVNGGGHLILMPGDFGQDKEERWWVRPPGSTALMVDGREIAEHKDGTITVIGEIVTDGWRGHLVKGMWWRNDGF